MHQNTLFKKPCDFRRGVSQKYSQIIVLFNSKCQNQKQTGSRVQRIGWKQPWITHTLFGGFEYYSAFDWGNYTYKSSTKITSWPNFNHKSQVSKVHTYILRRPQNFVKYLPYFCHIYVVPVKSKVEISQNCVAFSEYMNFNTEHGNAKFLDFPSNDWRHWNQNE